MKSWLSGFQTRRTGPAIILCAGLICLPLATVAAQTPAAKAKTRPGAGTDATAEVLQGCGLYQAMAARAVPSRERTFALRALKDCSASPAIARLLERAVRGDDFAARSAALESLETHLDRDSVPFLVNLYDASPPEDMDRDTEIRIFEYLSRLAEATPRAGVGPRVPGRVLRRGLYHSEARIRQAALRGLGRLDEARYWPLIEAALLNPKSPGERIAALQAARQMRNRDSRSALAAARQALELPPAMAEAAPDPSASRPQVDPGLERAALELLGALSGPRAFESLLIYRVRHSGGVNEEYLQKTIADRRDPKKNYAYALAPARLHAEATERSRIDASVAAYTVLYIEESTGLGYRLPPTGQRIQPEANWLRVRTTEGVAGWVHASRIQRLLVGD
ncbi:MAG: hypothetical protein RIF32_02150 [Leptospirales bacterium]